jgi:hypothetical protein
MGFGLPAAIGAKVGCPDRMVIDIDGDGSLNMTIHELSTCHRYGIGVKVVVINIQWLGMVRQWQDMIYRGRRAESSLSDPSTAVKRVGETDIYPDFLCIAQGYRVQAERVSRKEELRAAYERMLADPHEPYLLDIIVRPEENVSDDSGSETYKDIILSMRISRRLPKNSQGSTSDDSCRVLYVIWLLSSSCDSLIFLPRIAALLGPFLAGLAVDLTGSDSGAIMVALATGFLGFVISFRSGTIDSPNTVQPQLRNRTVPKVFHKRSAVVS